MTNIILQIARDLTFHMELDQGQADNMSACLHSALAEHGAKIVRGRTSSRTRQLEARIARVTAMADQLMNRRNQDAYNDGVADGFDQAAKILDGKEEI